MDWGKKKTDAPVASFPWSVVVAVDAACKWKRYTPWSVEYRQIVNTTRKIEKKLRNSLYAKALCRKLPFAGVANFYGDYNMIYHNMLQKHRWGIIERCHFGRPSEWAKIANRKFLPLGSLIYKPRTGQDPTLNRTQQSFETFYRKSDFSRFRYIPP